MNSKMKITGIVAMIAIGILSIYFTVQPPRFLVFLKGNGWRIGSGIIGVFFLIAGVVNIFHKGK